MDIVIFSLYIDNLRYSKLSKQSSIKQWIFYINYRITDMIWMNDMIWYENLRYNMILKYLHYHLNLY